MTTALIPAILLEKNVLVPIKIDITYSGARLVDTFCWNMSSPSQSIRQFADITCNDLNLPNGFRNKVFLQIDEQVNAFRELISLVHNFADKIPNWLLKVSEAQTISIGIRHNCVDYSEKIQWHPMDRTITPELFAENACREHGLPFQMEPAIAHKIRETLFRWLIELIEKSDVSPHEKTVPADLKLSEAKVTLVQPVQAVDMATNLWKRAKPNSLEEAAAIPQPLLPSNRDTNAVIWNVIS